MLQGNFSQDFSLYLFELGKLFICDSFTYVDIGDTYWEHDGRTLSKEKRGDLGAKSQGSFC